MSLPLPGAFPTRPVLAIATLAFATACSTLTETTPTQTTTTTAPAATKPAAAPEPQPAQLFKGLGSHTRAVSTKNEQAQTYFNQALTWTFSFNHDEAIRSYQKAADLDPNLAFAYWGIALCNGPHINNPVMDEPRAKAAWDALQKAKTLAAKGGATAQEQALITALAARYTDPSHSPIPFTFEERAPLDKAYADAMAKVYAQFPDDADIATLYAESLMDCRPWDLWEPETKEPRPEAPKVLAALEHALELSPNHPGANHYYIHAVEASTHPDKAVAAADRLRTLIPASGHMVHMPAHIDVRVGRWTQASEQNRQAITVDAAYRKLSPTQGIYRIYMAHNDHFLSWACMMLGRKQESLAAARHMIATIPKEFAKDAAPFVDPMMLVEMEALMRFGMWEDILKVPEPAEYHPITRAYRHFARASAFAAMNKISDAEAEQALFKTAVAAIPEKAMMVQNPAHKVLDLAAHTLAGEIAYRKGDTSAAVAELTKAVEIEDTLRYMEPPDWFQPSRHSLGAVLLAAGRKTEAEKVYRADLERWPENGWALYGLSECLESSAPEAAAVKSRFNKAWADADTKIKATCLCVTPAN
jgi:tetratricopeptide (TPR) repeat protein